MSISSATSWRAEPLSGPAVSGDPGQRLRALGLELADAVSAAFEPWAHSAVRRVVDAWSAAGGELALSPERVTEEAALAGARGASEVRDAMTALAVADVDDQRATPLQIVRRAIRFVTDVLRAAGVGSVQRERTAEEWFPDDHYALGPTSLGELGPGLRELALAWGAAKAAAHRERHQRRS